MKAEDYNHWVYILTNWKKTTLYTGVTNNLAIRLVEHYSRRGQPETFAGKYFCYNLVWYEWHQYADVAIAREKEIKDWNRAKKELLIAAKNPDWKFFNKEICGHWPPTGFGPRG